MPSCFQARRLRDPVISDFNPIYMTFMIRYLCVALVAAETLTAPKENFETFEEKMKKK